MQAPYRRFRRAHPALLVLLLGIAACQPLGFERPGLAPEERAARLSERGEHAAAAATLESAARAAAPERQPGLWLAAARAWLAGNDVAAAERALAEARAAPGSADAVEATRIAAEVALARGQTARALELLDPLARVRDPALLATRSQAYFAAGRTHEAVRALMERERLVTAPRARLANQQMIVDGVARSRPAPLPAGADPVLAGWLELGRILADARAGSSGTARRLQAWRSRYPAHPADPALWQDAGAEADAVSQHLPRRIALLLPLSGRAAAAGTAVRDGFLAAYYDVAPAQRPQLRMYDVAGQDAASAYRQALADGCDFVVGPLTREEVVSLAVVADGRASILALNFLPEGYAAPDRFFQFALSPEDEARLAARRAVGDGRRQGLVLVPQSDWGRRVATAFAEELAAAGGRVLEAEQYGVETTDFNDLLRRMLRTSGQRGSAPRADAQFVFIGAQPLHARLIRSQLRFIYAGAVPVYATSDAYDPSGRGASDLDGLVFPDMPWVLESEGPAAAARRALAAAWPGQTAAQDRLHAFGYDAFRLTGELRRPWRGRPPAIPGMTGELKIGGDGRVHRELGWAQMVDGRPALLPPAGGIGTAP